MSFFAFLLTLLVACSEQTEETIDTAVDSDVSDSDVSDSDVSDSDN
jgi:hypothetical protein